MVLTFLSTPGLIQRIRRISPVPLAGHPSGLALRITLCGILNSNIPFLTLSSSLSYQPPPLPRPRRDPLFSLSASFLLQPPSTSNLSCPTAPHFTPHFSGELSSLPPLPLSHLQSTDLVLPKPDVSACALSVTGHPFHLENHFSWDPIRLFALGSFLCCLSPYVWVFLRVLSGPSLYTSS